MSRWMDVYLQEDWQALSASVRDISARWRNVNYVQTKRYSHKQQQTLFDDGLCGQVIFDTDSVISYLPILRLGEELNIGKGSSRGLGSYRVEVF